jgi:hypothetical protein
MTDAIVGCGVLVSVCSPLPSSFDRVLQVLDLSILIDSAWPSCICSLSIPSVLHITEPNIPCERILQVGDASGIQSPISFGGFGAITRHLGRLSNGTSLEWS